MAHQALRRGVATEIALRRSPQPKNYVFPTSSSIHPHLLYKLDQSVFSALSNGRDASLCLPLPEPSKALEQRAVRSDAFSCFQVIPGFTSSSRASIERLSQGLLARWYSRSSIPRFLQMIFRAPWCRIRTLVLICALPLLMCSTFTFSEHRLSHFGMNQPCLPSCVELPFVHQSFRHAFRWLIPRCRHNAA